MKCPRCQRDNPTGSSFCLECGARLGLTCTSCGTDLPAGSKFCNKCGTAVSSPAAGQPRFPSPECYTPKHLAERILNSKVALEGERKQVTVLFADLKGSMELFVDRDPEDARKILDPVLEHMMEAVHRYEGTVNQVMGDGIMALFGAPLAHEDHAVRACYAALRMQDTVKRYADGVRRSQGVEIQIRVGMNSGEVVVRAIGNDLHMDYTAVGETTHLAARIEQAARPGAVLIAPATLNLVEGFVAVKSLGPMPVKGRSEPLEVYELSGIGPARTRLQAAARRGLTRFVGRDAEVEMLRQSFERAGAGHGQAVALVGEAGVGKSRLVWEFTRSQRTHGWLMLESGSLSYGRTTPYLPVIELLKAYLNIQERDDQREIRERVAGKLLTLDPTPEPFVTPLLALLDVPVDGTAWGALDPPQRRQRILEAVKRLLLRESQVQPLLLLFEDLHWIDSESQALLDGLIESLPTARILLVVSYRPEYQHDWGSKSYYTQLWIDPFPPQSAEELLTALMGQDESLETLKRVLIERTEGNPFFLEETVQTLVESKVLVGDRGAYRITKAPAAWQIPATVQAILAARIDRLPSEDKPLLQAASVIGKDVPFTLLQAIADVPEESLRRGLTLLQAAEFLYETRVFPDLEYTFKHALTHEVSYASVLHDRRRALHARIVEAIEALYPDRLAEQVDQLAHHALHGEVWPKALTYLRQAGARAGTRSAYREAVTCFEQALVAVAHLPESRETTAQTIDVQLELAGSLTALGRNQKVLDYLRVANGLAAALDDRSRLARVLAWECNSLREALEFDRAIKTGERALTIAKDLGELDLSVIARYGLGLTFYDLGDLIRAHDLLRWVVEALGPEVTSLADPRPEHASKGRRKGEAREDQCLIFHRFKVQAQRMGLGLGPTTILVAPRVWLTLTLGYLGQFIEGISLGEEAIRIAESSGHQYDCSIASNALGTLYLIKGDLDRAIPQLERSLTLARSWSRGWRGWSTNGILGQAYAQAGRCDVAFQLLQEVFGSKQVISKVRSSPFRHLGEIYLRAGHPAEASEHARKALDLARYRKQRRAEALALRLLGEVAAHPDRFQPAEAGECSRQALVLADELGMRPLLAQCHLDLGKLYRRTGKREEAQGHLTTATTMFREMDMGCWLERAEAEMRGSM